jgi:poly(3-hydroxybutyrate) depolymerase
MVRVHRYSILCLISAAPLFAAHAAPSVNPALHTAGQPTAQYRPPRPELAQETGFLNRRIELRGIVYRYVVYVPEDYRRDDHRQWPIILALHGRGERGSEGLWQTQIGLPQAVRDHPERWPFLIVMPQCPLSSVWTDSDMLALAMASLDKETEEFHADPERTYLTGLSLGGYGAWELAKADPHRWAAIAIIAGGIFWSYQPERWQEVATLPAEYAAPLVQTPVWLFHGGDDPVVPTRESEVMYDALKTAGGHVRLWIYQGLKHDSWTRAYDEPELPRWLLAHRTQPPPAPGATVAEAPPQAERLVIPFHPPALKLAPSLLDALVGIYTDKDGRPIVTIFRQADQLFEKNLQGEIAALDAETSSVFFYVNGSSSTRLTFEHDTQGRITELVLRDDRHEERWEKRPAADQR